jgi:hypothetical protein
MHAGEVTDRLDIMPLILRQRNNTREYDCVDGGLRSQIEEVRPCHQVPFMSLQPLIIYSVLREMIGPDS